MCAKSLQQCLTCVQSCGLQPTRVLYPQDSLGKNKEWVAMPSSKGSSPPRDRTRISYITCTGSQVLYHQVLVRSPIDGYLHFKKCSSLFTIKEMQVKTMIRQHFTPTAAAAAKSLQQCPTLCNPIDNSPSGSPIPGILQARILEWVAISFSNSHLLG